jgi:anti-sigma B factor antagonist
LTTKIVTVQIAHRQHKPGVAVIEMKGSIHAGPDCQRVEHEVDALLRESKTHVIFDLTHVTHIDSAAVGTIVTCFSRVKRSGAALRIAGSQGMVEGTLKLTQVHKVIPMYPTAAQAAEDLTAPS